MLALGYRNTNNGDLLADNEEKNDMGDFAEEWHCIGNNV